MHGHVRSRKARAPPRMRAPSRHAPKMRLLAERREVVVAIWMRFHRRRWMTEEAAHADRRRSLMQDNPASG